MDVIHLGDAEGNRCIVRILGRLHPGVPTGHDVLRAEVLASADFDDVRLDTFLTWNQLDTWRHQLSRLVPGKNAGIASDRGLNLGLYLCEDRSLSVSLDDPDRFGADFRIRPHDSWMDDHIRRFEQTQHTWPSEVAETAPGVYEWRRNLPT